MQIKLFLYVSSVLSGLAHLYVCNGVLAYTLSFSKMNHLSQEGGCLKNPG